MGTRELRKWLERLRAEEVTFEEFERNTRGVWAGIAGYTIRRWRLPEHRGTQEDMLQEVLIAVWIAVQKFDPRAGKTIEAYVLYNAGDKAGKRAHKWRGAKRHSGKNPSRIPVLFSSLGGADADAGEAQTVAERLMLGAGSFTPPDHEAVVERAEALQRALGVCEGLVEQLVLVALAKSVSLDEGAKRLYEDARAREACRVKSQRGAKRVVTEAAIAVMIRLADAEDIASERAA